MSRVAPTMADPHPNQPAPRLVLGAQIGAAGLIGFGLILFVASQWGDMSQWTRFGLVSVLLLAAGLLAILKPRWRISGLLLALMTTGGLLSLVGITYQTGADPWQLFALWAALTLPLALAARHDAVWCAWTLVASTALPLWVHAMVGWMPRGNQSAVVLAHWIMTAILAGLFSPWTGLGRWIGTTRWAFRLATTLLLILITKDAVASLYRDGAIFLLGLLAFGALVAALAYAKPFDFSLIAVATLAADVLLIAALWRFSLPAIGNVGAMIVLGLLSAGIIIGSVRLLFTIGDGAVARLRSMTGAQEASALTEPVLARWPAILLSAVGAVFAAVPFLFVYGLLFGTALSSAPIALVIGAGTLAAGAALASGGGDYGFRQIFGLIALVTGGVVIGYGLLRTIPHGAAFILGAMIATGLTTLIPVRWINALLGFIAALCVCAALVFGLFSNPLQGLLSPPIVSLMVTALLGLALRVALARPSIATSIPHVAIARGRSFAMGWTTAMLLATMAAAGPTFLLGATVSTRAVSSLTVSAALLTITPARVFAVALVAAAVSLALAQRPVLKTPTGYALAVLSIVFSYVSPPFAIALAVGATMSALGNRPIAILAAFVALWCIGALYYWVGISFEQKALILMALGLILGVVTLLDSGGLPTLAAGTRSSAGNTGFTASMLIAASLVATGATVSASVMRHETILNIGRPVFIALAPVDPRSLMQGDFMALRFAMPAVPGELHNLGRLQATASVDPRNIATIKRIAKHPATLAAGEVRVDLTYKGGWTVATDAFFFREGQARTFEAARFGEFRLKGDGTILLVGLADKDLRPLGR